VNFPSTPFHAEFSKDPDASVTVMFRLSAPFVTVFAIAYLRSSQLRFRKRGHDREATQRDAAFQEFSTAVIGQSLFLARLSPERDHPVLPCDGWILEYFKFYGSPHLTNDT
jgi:hypothetical protein